MDKLLAEHLGNNWSAHRGVRLLLRHLIHRKEIFYNTSIAHFACDIDHCFPVVVHLSDVFYAVFRHNVKGHLQMGFNLALHPSSNHKYRRIDKDRNLD